MNVDEAFFLGGAAKETVLAAFGAQMFFDDQDSHVRPASGHVPAGIVPHAGGAAAARCRADHFTGIALPTGTAVMLFFGEPSISLSE